MFKKYSLLFFITGACMVSGKGVHAQNIPDLSQTAPSGSATVIPVPDEIGNNLTSRNTVTHYTVKVKITNPDAIENAAGNQVNQSVEYRDGNNQTYQSIIFRNSRTESGQLKDLVQPVNTRLQKDQYSFLPFARNVSGGFQVNAFSASKSYYQALYPGEGYTSYSAKKYFSTSGYRETRSYAPGKSRVGQNRYTAQRTISNNTGQVRIWKLDGNGYPVSAGFYPANTLFGVKVTDPEGHKTISYKNKSGRLVLKQVQDGASSFASTYYVYDDMGRLRYTLPAAVAASGNGTVSAAVRTKLCFHYVYDDKGRLVAQSKPGQNGALTEIVYDRLQRPVMRRNPKERNAGEWEVTFYGHSGRIIATSLYKNSSSRAAWQNVFDSYSGSTFPSNNIKYYIVSDAGAGKYPPENGISNNTMMSYTWYDDYTVIDPNNAIFNEVESAMDFGQMVPFPGALLPERSKRTHGLITGAKVRILPAPGIDTATTGDWKQTWNYYDDKGQVIYVESKDLYHNTTVHKHLRGTEYDFTSKAILSKHIMANERSKDGATEHTELNHNEYDAVTGQLVKTYHKVDDGAWSTQDVYEYDGLGRLKTESLGNGGEDRDYSYNIRGQLTGINGQYAETGYQGVGSRTFGESLKYDYGFSHPRYDGKITGMVWRGSGAVHTKALAYGYTYDPAGRLTQADFREGAYQGGHILTPSQWDKDTMDYTISNLSYDKNSNIKNKDMMGPGFDANNVPQPTAIDKLTYAYAANSNRLASVTDNITQNYEDGDFQDGNTSGSDYAYDADGNLSKDLNKGISSVSYTWFNKPQKITFTNGNTIFYSYTAAGNKVQELINTDDHNKTTGYIGNFVYQNDSLQYASTAVGRTVWNQDTVKEEYFVKDHLGNVRSIVEVYQYPLLEYLASYEIASAQLEEAVFDNVEEIRDDKPGSTNPQDSKAGRLNGADQKIGTSILMKVMAGDQVKINADNYYDGTYDPRDDQPVNAEDMLSSIVTTLMNGEGGLGRSESHNPELVPKLFNPENYAEANDIMQRNVDEGRPKAFLNYVLFDENMRVVRTFTGAWQANGAGGWQTIGNDEPMKIPENGYLAVYLSNASNFAECTHCTISEGDVYFDRVNIQISRGKLKEETHYYPFGLPMAGMGSSAMGMTLNRQKYQSNEYVTDAGLNWMSFGARQYDPQLGRFLSVDPLAAAGGQDMLSPYQAMGNNPVSMTDPLGLAPPQKLVAQEKPTTANPLAAVFMRLSGTTLNEVLSGADDPLHQSFWYNHRIGKDGKLYTLVLDMDGNIIGATLGDYGTRGASVVANLTMWEGPKGNGGPDGGDDKADNNNSNTVNDGSTVTGQMGNIGFGMSVSGYMIEKGAIGFRAALGRGLSMAGDAVGGAGLYFDYKNYKAGKMSAGRFSYHVFSFGTSTIIGNALGASAGIETGGFFFYLETVQMEGQVLWDNFKASYNSWYQQSVMTIENGGNPFEHMHYSF